MIGSLHDLSHTLYFLINFTLTSSFTKAEISVLEFLLGMASLVATKIKFNPICYLAYSSNITTLISLHHSWRGKILTPPPPYLSFSKSSNWLLPSKRRDICTPRFTVAWFTAAMIQNQPKSPLMDEWIKKMWCIYTYIHIHRNREEKWLLGAGENMARLVRGYKLSAIRLTMSEDLV